MFNFKNTEAAQENSFMKPGIYRLKITAVKADKFTNEKATDFLGIDFTDESGAVHTEKFILSEKAINRLQYLHEAWTGKKLDKEFKTIAEVEKYFKAAFVNAKAGTRLIKVGGEKNGDKVFAQLPYTGFIVNEDDFDGEVGEFTEGDENWKKYVKLSTRTTQATGKKNGILNDDDGDDEPEATPSAKAGAKKAAAATGTKKSNAKPAADTSDDKSEDEDDEDLPW